MSEQLTHDHFAGNYIYIDAPDRQSITQIGKCETCHADITRRVHVVGEPIFTEWVALP